MAEPIYRGYGRKYHWPEIQLNIWLLVVLTASASCLGMFSWFMSIQTQMLLGTPWVFPFMVTSSALALSFLVLILVLAARRSLVPGIIILGSFILWVLWLTGLIGTALQLYGTSANVNANCQNFVMNMEYQGQSINTLAWMTQVNICNCWKAAFAFEVVNTVFFLWMLFMSWQVHKNDY